jgi:endonuclease/exonuclease/phosphatase family metal-dependent hydrolase
MVKRLVGPRLQRVRRWIARQGMIATRGGSVRKALARELPGRTRYRTFPSMCPLLRLDRIYCRPADVLVASSIDALARRLSDHIAVLADIRPAVRG